MKVVWVDEPIVARSFGFFGYERIYFGRAFLSLDDATKSAVIAHEVGHLVLRHSEMRILLVLTVIGLLWASRMARWQEFEADKMAAEAGHALPLYRFLSKYGTSSTFHPTISQRCEKLLYYINSHGSR